MARIIHCRASHPLWAQAWGQPGSDALCGCKHHLPLWHRHLRTSRFPNSRRGFRHWKVRPVIVGPEDRFPQSCRGIDTPGLEWERCSMTEPWLQGRGFCGLMFWSTGQNGEAITAIVQKQFYSHSGILPPSETQRCGSVTESRAIHRETALWFGRKDRELLESWKMSWYKAWKLMVYTTYMV